MLKLVLHPIELVDFLRVCANRPDEARPRDVWSPYALSGEALRGPPATLAGAAHVELLVVVTTYNRPGACALVLEQLSAALEALEPRRSVHLLVLNDHSAADYAPVVHTAERLFGAGFTWLNARERLGKPGFFRAYQVAFSTAALLSPEHALFLQDDLEFEPTLLASTYELWERTAHDRDRRVLYLFSSPDDEKFGRWTLSRRKRLGALHRTQWFDLQAFFVDRAFFELLRYRMIPIHPNRWRRVRSLSSGVGKQLTLRLRFRGNVYQAVPPLVFHGGASSQMNDAARHKRPLDNRSLRKARREG